MTTTEKTCFKCGDMKPIADFYRHARMKDGHLNKCKQCCRDYSNAHRAANIDRYRLYDKARASLPHREASREAYRKTEHGKSAVSRARKAYIQRNPAKRAAQIACGNAIRSGMLVKQPCEKCGNVNAQAHHDDYTKPLDVRWLCTTHHAEWHRHNQPITEAA